MVLATSYEDSLQPNSKLWDLIGWVYFEGINFRGNAFRNVFADLIFVELGLFINSRF